MLFVDIVKSCKNKDVIFVASEWRMREAPGRSSSREKRQEVIFSYKYGAEAEANNWIGWEEIAGFLVTHNNSWRRRQ